MKLTPGIGKEKTGGGDDLEAKRVVDERVALLDDDDDECRQ